jgi:hypothetical protein
VEAQEMNKIIKRQPRVNRLDSALARPPAGGIVQGMKKPLATLTTILMTTAWLFAASTLSGTWNAKVDLGSQTGSPTFVLKQDGQSLSGTYSGALGEAPLKGAVNGKKVTWDFEVSGAQVHYTGTISDDGSKIEGTVDYGGQASGTFTATRNETDKK